jgi:hypothetical protein
MDSRATSLTEFISSYDHRMMSDTLNIFPITVMLSIISIIFTEKMMSCHVIPYFRSLVYQSLLVDIDSLIF